jgi:hypothetical protein
MSLKKKYLYIIIIAGLIITNLFSIFLLIEIKLRIAYAEEQIKIFYFILNKSGDLLSPDIESSLNYVENYYPSGTKQIKDTRLDQIVELVRKDVIKQLTKNIPLTQPEKEK